MFGFFNRDPAKKLKRVYNQKLEQAMLAQRKGDIKKYSELTAEAESLWSEIQSLEDQNKK